MKKFLLSITVAILIVTGYVEAVNGLARVMSTPSAVVGDRPSTTSDGYGFNPVNSANISRSK